MLTRDPLLGGKVRKVGFLKEALSEPGGKSPSSARLIAAFIFGSLTLLTFLITLVLLYRISIIQDPILGTALLQTLTRIVLTWFLFFAATGLSLYGINVWRYISVIQTGKLDSPADLQNIKSSFLSQKQPSELSEDFSATLTQKSEIDVAESKPANFVNRPKEESSLDYSKTDS